MPDLEPKRAHEGVLCIFDQFPRTAEYTDDSLPEHHQFNTGREDGLPGKSFV